MKFKLGDRVRFRREFVESEIAPSIGQIVYLWQEKELKKERVGIICNRQKIPFTAQRVISEFTDTAMPSFLPYESKIVYLIATGLVGFRRVLAEWLTLVEDIKKEK